MSTGSLPADVAVRLQLATAVLQRPDVRSDLVATGKDLLTETANWVMTGRWAPAPVEPASAEQAAIPAPQDAPTLPSEPELPQMTAVERRAEQLLGHLTVLADRGEAVGTNAEIVAALGWGGIKPVAVSNALGNLIQRGAIDLEARGAGRASQRRVTIVATGRQTPWASTERKPAAAAEKKHDRTLSRFPGHAASPDRVVPLPADHPALTEARTIFTSTVVRPDESPRLLVSGHNSRKIGAEVRKGPWKGMPIYTLTLEERATCPSSCQRWADCYGNAMPFARRHRHGFALATRLGQELEQLDKQHRQGFVVRLHVLGDFWSPQYVSFWRSWLHCYRRLHVFGYTAHPRTSEIGQAVEALNLLAPERWQILFSVGAEEASAERQAVTVRSADEAQQAGAILCPAQTGRTEACATCGLCWAPAATSRHRIAFLLHGRRARGKSRNEMAPAGAPASDGENTGPATALQVAEGGRPVPSRDDVPPSQHSPMLTANPGEPPKILAPNESAVETTPRDGHDAQAGRHEAGVPDPQTLTQGAPSDELALEAGDEVRAAADAAPSPAVTPIAPPPAASKGRAGSGLPPVDPFGPDLAEIRRRRAATDSLNVPPKRKAAPPAEAPGPAAPVAGRYENVDAETLRREALLLGPMPPRPVQGAMGSTLAQL
jgi:hypothetical protein